MKSGTVSDQEGIRRSPPVIPQEQIRDLESGSLKRQYLSWLVLKQPYQSRRERIFGGVCGGIDTSFDTDPNIIRILGVLLTLVSIGIVAHLVTWLLIPEEPGPSGDAVIGAGIGNE
jgi:phage shock protein PspC (stress-responsive transcriptional regulator)